MAWEVSGWWTNIGWVLQSRILPKKGDEERKRKWKEKVMKICWEDGKGKEKRGHSQ